MLMSAKKNEMLFSSVLLNPRSKNNKQQYCEANAIIKNIQYETSDMKRQKQM